jgi:hypothetical protein
MAVEEKHHVPELANHPKPQDASQSSDSDVESYGHIDEKRLLRKLDIRLLPAVSILYLLSFLDRSNGASKSFCYIIQLYLTTIQWPTQESRA